MSATIFCIARHGTAGRHAGYRKLGRVRVHVEAAPPQDAPSPAAPAVAILSRVSLPLGPSLAEPQPAA
ncbi:hypothetical protein CEK28_06195 [Xenophilus sp. AP218F]|nr:hypothetical protein [Chromobacterium sp. ASV5]OWY40307.1 hypothetical protein CEK28_06195 [Xenophilus sp. AP218F]